MLGRYPFTACEVFCCEVEAVFNTLLDDAELLALLFSLLEQESPLSAKTAGYFGRLVGHLLLRKTSELMQYIQASTCGKHAQAVAAAAAALAWMSNTTDGWLMCCPLHHTCLPPSTDAAQRDEGRTLLWAAMAVAVCRCWCGQEGA